MPELARHIVIDHEREKLLIDGTELPWIISEDGPIPSVEPGDGVARVTVTLFADKVEVVGTPKLPAPAGRDDRGDIRTFEGQGALIARKRDTRADVQAWRDMSTKPRFIAMYDAALAVFDAEEANRG
ncbi:hypothetical protein [Nocardia tengchongensis]|uniref:hypothetical protein n=1 Tax=Nocardia tengchongensis TaxID=2055889 RepID=UPI003653867E